MSQPRPDATRSPDGYYWWDGTQWIPVPGMPPQSGMPFAPYAPAWVQPRSAGRRLLNLSACAVVATLMIVLGLGAYGVSRQAQRASLPRFDAFPTGVATPVGADGPHRLLTL